MKQQAQTISVIWVLLLFTWIPTSHAQLTYITAARPALTTKTASFPFQITSISDSNQDNSGTIGEVLNIHGTGFGTSGAIVTIGTRFGQPVSAAVISQNSALIQAIVPAGIDTGIAAPVRLTVGPHTAQTAYPVSRYLVYVTNSRTYALQILNADTLLPVGPAFNFDALGVLDGNNAATQPLDVVINQTGDTAYILMKKRLYMMDLIQHVINTAAPINFTDGNVFHGFLTPNENYFLTTSIQTNFLFPFTSRIGPLPGGAVQTVSLALQTDLSIPQNQSFAYLSNGSHLAKLSLTPNYTVVSNNTVGSGALLTQVGISPNDALIFVGESTNGNDRVNILDLPALTPHAGSPLTVPGEIQDLALTYPNGQDLLVADCMNNQVHRINTSNGSSTTLNLADCPQFLQTPANGVFAYVARSGSNFVLPPSYISRWDLASNTISGTYQDNNAVPVGFAAQR